MKVTIEIDKNGEYWAYNNGDEPFVCSGTGSTIELAKKDFLEAVEHLKKDYKENELPKELCEPHEFIPDLESFVKYLNNLATKPIRTVKQRATFQTRLNNFGRSIATFAF